MSDHKDKIEVTDISNGELYASRKHIYVRLINGLFTKLRFFSNFALFAAFFGTLWLDWEGRQAVLFDLPARQFHIFGLTFFPQDFALVTWIMIILAFTLFFVTVFAGRVWCGYTCPQSVWTWLYIWIEDKVEGKRNARIKLDNAPFSKQKLLRKSSKHFLWFAVALLTAITFVGYFTPVKTLVADLVTLSISGWSLFWVAFFAVATYGNAGWLREQVCIYMCPYARFQGVMFDKDTLIVSYDAARGENRGARKRGIDPKTENLGDCIDCDLCVQVCPVGIDIRDGLQYECITCAACIDACDSVMDKMGYERGLVRYTTEHSLNGESTNIIRPRLVGYGVALMIMLALFSYSVTSRTPIELDIIRGRGELFKQVDDNLIENTYSISVLNMDQTEHQYRISVSGIDGLQMINQQDFTIAATDNFEFVFKLQADQANLLDDANSIEITITSIDQPDMSVTEQTTFFGPYNF